MANFVWNSDMHLIEHKIHDIHKLLFSPFAKPFKTPIDETRNVQCYFCTVQVEKAFYTSYIVFLEPLKKQTFFYQYKTKPYPAADLFRVEEEGVKFCLEYGFDLDDPQIWLMEENKRFGWLRNQGIFNCIPSGEFFLRPSTSKVVADGSTIVRILSDPVPTPSGVPPADGTPFFVTATMGEITGEIIEKRDKTYLLPCNRGILYFQLRAPSQKGRCAITAKSEDGKAFANTVVFFHAGLPHGTIQLKSSVNFLIADGESVAEISSMNILDAAGNIVADETEIIVESTLGTIVATEFYYQDDDLIVPVKEGRVHFKYCAGTNVGLGEIRIRAKNSDASGHLKCMLIPGTPHGSFTVISSQLSLKADGTSTTEIIAGPLRDRYGNTVADNQMLIMQSSMGEILTSPDDPSGSKSCELATKDGKVSCWLRTGQKPGTAYISVRNFDRTAAGSCSVEFV